MYAQLTLSMNKVIQLTLDDKRQSKFLLRKSFKIKK